MMKPGLRWLAVIALLAPAASADTILSGHMNDPGNTALVGSDLTSPLFDNDDDIADNVALYTLTIGTPGNFDFLSKGFGLGGVDPYFTLFSGTGNSATFLGSNFDQAFSTGGDFDLNFPLAAGQYTVALGVFANISSAENLGTGTLGDGFIFLGEPGSLGNYFYELDISSTTGTIVPEPFGVAPVVLSFLALAVGVRRFQKHGLKSSA